MASHVSLQKPAAALLAVVLVFACAGCGKTNCNTILIPKSYYDYFGANPADDVASVKGLGSKYVTRAYRRSGGIAIIANNEQKKNLLKVNQNWINFYGNIILEASPRYSIKTSPDYRCTEITMDYKLNPSKRSEAMEGLTYWLVLSQLFHGTGDDWSLHIVIRDANSHKVVYRVSLPQTPIDFNEETWNL